MLPPPEESRRPKTKSCNASQHPALAEPTRGCSQRSPKSNSHGSIAGLPLSGVDERLYDEGCCRVLVEPACLIRHRPISTTALQGPAPVDVWLRPPGHAHIPKCWCQQSTYRSCSSSRERGGVHRKSKPLRRRARARLRACWYPLRSRTACSSRAATKALMDVPSSAARIRASFSSSASIFKVMLVFTSAPFYVLHHFTCGRGPNQSRSVRASCLVIGGQLLCTLLTSARALPQTPAAPDVASRGGTSPASVPCRCRTPA